MGNDQGPASLSELVLSLRQATGDDAQVTLGRLLDVGAHRSFGLALLIPALLLVSPLSGVPGLASMLGIGVLLVSVQVLIGRSCLWLPEWLLRRRVPAEKARNALRWLDRPAHFLDRHTRQRLLWVSHGAGIKLTALICTILALMVPLLDLVPMANSMTGAVLIVFSLGLFVRDGLWLLAGLIAFVALVCGVAWFLTSASAG